MKVFFVCDVCFVVERVTLYPKLPFFQSSVLAGIPQAGFLLFRPRRMEPSLFGNFLGVCGAQSCMKDSYPRPQNQHSDLRNYQSYWHILFVWLQYIVYYPSKPETPIPSAWGPTKNPFFEAPKSTSEFSDSSQASEQDGQL